MNAIKPRMSWDAAMPSERSKVARWWTVPSHVARAHYLLRNLKIITSRAPAPPWARALVLAFDTPNVRSGQKEALAEVKRCAGILHADPTSANAFEAVAALEDRRHALVRWLRQLQREANLIPRKLDRYEALELARAKRTEQAKKREARARTMLAKAERHLQRAQASVQRWRTRVAAYDRKAGGQAPKPGLQNGSKTARGRA